MKELYSIINEFDVRMTDDREEDRDDDTGLDFEKEFGPDRHGKSMTGDEIDGGEPGDDFGDEEFAGGDPEDGMGDMDGEEPEYGDAEGDDEMFAGEKRTDITHLLQKMLQRRGIGDDGEEGPEGAETSELPDLDDLDLDLSADSDYEEDGEDPDFDYSAFSDKGAPKEDDDEEVDFNFDIK